MVDRERVLARPSDHRDSMIEELLASEAALLDNLVEALLDAQSYRVVAQEALHVLHDQHRKYDRLYDDHARLGEEYRWFREHVLDEAGARS
jgi:hypothetical protein